MDNKLTAILIAAIIIVAGCSTVTKTPPAPKSIYPPGFSFNGVPPPPGTNTNQGTNVPIVLPTFNLTNDFLIYPITFDQNYTTNGSGQVLNLVHLTITNVIVGHTYEVWQRNNYLTNGGISTTNGWSPHGTVTATTNWFTNLSLTTQEPFQRYWIAQDLTP